MKTIKKQIKGISLVALVVTIIVLLILAGTVITLIIGNNGIITRSQRGAKEYNKQEATEKLNFKITSSQINKYAENGRLPTLQELANDLLADEEIEYVKPKETLVASTQKVNVGSAKSIYTKLKEYSYKFEIDSNLRLASIDDVKIADTNDTLEAKLNELNDRISEIERTNDERDNKIGKLENDIKALNEKLDNAKLGIYEEIYNYDTAANNKADAAGVYSFSFPTGKNLQSYKRLHFYVDAYSAGINTWCSKQQKTIDALVDNTAFAYADGYTSVNSKGGISNTFTVTWNIPDNTHFKIDGINVYNFAKARIYKIVGEY